MPYDVQLEDVQLWTYAMKDYSDLLIKLCLLGLQTYGRFVKIGMIFQLSVNKIGSTKDGNAVQKLLLQM